MAKALPNFFENVMRFEFGMAIGSLAVFVVVDSSRHGGEYLPNRELIVVGKRRRNAIEFFVVEDAGERFAPDFFLLFGRR